MIGLAACVLAAPLARAEDDQPQPTAAPGELRTAQLQWLFGSQPRRSEPSSRTRAKRGAAADARYYYVRSRDVFGNPGPVYRVLGVERSKQTKRRLAVADWHKQRAAELLRHAPPAPPTKGPLLLAISLGKQQLTLYDQGVAIAQSPISSGTSARPTPTGVFAVIQKQWWHRSNLYSAAPMPFMQRLTWSGVAVHAGDLPGYPASHGCIRLPEDFAIRLWGTTRIGVRVIVTHGEVQPVEIANPHLFAPKPKTKPDQSDTPMAANEPPSRQADAAIQGLQPLAQRGELALGSVPITPVALDRAAASEGLALLAAIDSDVKLVRPDGTPAASLAEPLQDDDAADDPRDGQDDVADTRSITVVRGGQPTQVVELAEPPDVTENGTARITIVRGGRTEDIDVIAIEKAAPEPQLALPLAAPELPVVVANAGAYAAMRTGAQRRAQQPEAVPATPPAPQARPLRPGPLSVFISRKTRRLYVRKGFEPLFDMPVTIANPDQKLGTHVFTAIAVNENDATARWDVVSLPVEATRVREVAERSKHSRKLRHHLVTEFVSMPAPASASEALDRIEMPAEAVTRISELLSPGASLIITDEGLGPETGSETDFTVLTK